MIIHVELPSCSLTCSPSFYTIYIIPYIYILFFFGGDLGAAFAAALEAFALTTTAVEECD